MAKLGAVRGADGSWNPAHAPADLTRGVHDNLKNLGIDAIDVVNLRAMDASEAMIEESFSALADLQRQGLIRQLGLSNVTSAQLKIARKIAPVVCVQNLYNIAHRKDDALIDAHPDIAFVPFFPLGGFSPVQSSILSDVAKELDATPMQTALAWLLKRAPNILLIPGTSSVKHLQENLAAAELKLSDSVFARLSAIGKEATH